jgi:hypothetical protein
MAVELCDFGAQRIALRSLDIAFRSWREVHFLEEPLSKECSGGADRAAADQDCEGRDPDLRTHR